MTRAKSDTRACLHAAYSRCRGAVELRVPLGYSHPWELCEAHEEQASARELEARRKYGWGASEPDDFNPDDAGERMHPEDP